VATLHRALWPVCGPSHLPDQRRYLIVIRRWFGWLHEQGILRDDVAADLEIPKPEERLPVDILTANEVESTMNQTNVDRPMGLRDRAILETLYSTAIRASELAKLQLYDLDAERKIGAEKGSGVFFATKGRSDRWAR
jgi:integrase/recombinase XerD